jgi:hypothetical protein
MVVDVAFPTSDDAATLVEPGEEAFRLPTAARAAKRAAVLGAGSAIGRDHSTPYMVMCV